MVKRDGPQDIPVYPLRPELIESTYYLYRATKDPKARRAIVCMPCQ